MAIRRNVYFKNEDHVRRADAWGLNLSRICQEALADAVDGKSPRRLAAELRRRANRIEKEGQ